MRVEEYMCLAIPGKIISIEKSIAKVEFGGIQRIIALDLLPDTIPGDYILAHAGFAIQKIDKNEAQELIELFQTIENELYKSNEPTS